MGKKYLLYAQHKRLFEIIESLQNDIIHFRNIDESLLKLSVYVKEHFETENRVLLQMSKPENIKMVEDDIELFKLLRKGE